MWIKKARVPVCGKKWWQLQDDKRARKLTLMTATRMRSFHYNSEWNMYQLGPLHNFKTVCRLRGRIITPRDGRQSNGATKALVNYCSYIGLCWKCFLICCCTFHWQYRPTQIMADYLAWSSPHQCTVMHNNTIICVGLSCHLFRMFRNISK